MQFHFQHARAHIRMKKGRGVFGISMRWKISISEICMLSDRHCLNTKSHEQIHRLNGFFYRDIYTR